MQIKRQLRSIYYRFIMCEEENHEVQLNTYDSSFQKEKVETFLPNPLHNKKI